MIGDALSGAGLLLAAGLAAAAMVLPPSRLRSAAMVAALALCPLLILGEEWNSAQVSAARDEPLRLAAFALLGLGIVAALAAVFSRRPWLLPLAAVAALPFRVPLEAGGEEANLLVPLYLVIAAGVVAAALRDRGPAGPLHLPRGPLRKAIASPAAVRCLLGLFVALYALEALYSTDFRNAVNISAFFLIPFSLLFAMLAGVEWDRRLLAAALGIVAAEALVFAAVGFAEFGIRELIWNEEVIVSNEFHVYFRVNSLFWDPNVFGRYLALAITALLAVVIWTRDRRLALQLSAVAAVLWLALLITFSQSSFAALIAGLAVLAALRWSLRWTAVACGIGLLAAIAALFAAGFSLDELNEDTSGREGLVSGGIELFGNRPLWGYGSGSFAEAFIEEVVGAVPPVSESHNEPLTVAAEQGLIGLTAYLALLAAALAMLCSGLRGLMPGLGGGRDPGDGEAWPAIARAALLAAFVALLVHTVAYAGFFEDPIAWVLMAIGASLVAGGVADRGDSGSSGPVRAQT